MPAKLINIRPMLAVSNGSLWLMSTPYGKRGFFYETWAHATRNPGTGTGSTWEQVRVPATECPRIKKEFLAEELATMGDSRLTNMTSIIYAPDNSWVAFRSPDATHLAFGESMKDGRLVRFDGSTQCPMNWGTKDSVRAPVAMTSDARSYVMQWDASGVAHIWYGLDMRTVGRPGHQVTSQPPLRGNKTEIRLVLKDVQPGFHKIDLAREAKGWKFKGLDASDIGAAAAVAGGPPVLKAYRMALKSSDPRAFVSSGSGAPFLVT